LVRAVLDCTGAVRGRLREKMHEARRIKPLSLDRAHGMDHAKEEARTGVIAVAQAVPPTAVARLSTTALCAFPLAMCASVGMAPAPFFIVGQSP